MRRMLPLARLSLALVSMAAPSGVNSRVR